MDSLSKTPCAQSLLNVNPFRLKEFSDEGANHLRSPPVLPRCVLNSKFGKGWWKIEGVSR